MPFCTAYLNNLCCRLLLALLLCTVGSASFGQIIANWPFGATQTAPNTVDPNATASVATITTPTPATSIVSSRFRGQGWNVPSIDLARYFEVSITPNSGYDLTIQQFVINLDKSANGPTAYEARISTDNFTTAVSIGNGPVTTTTTNVSMVVSSVVRVTATAKIRVYFWGASTSTDFISIGSATISGKIVQPTLTTIPITLSGFTTTLGVPSATKNYSISGANLFDDLVITAPAGYEISTSAGGGFNPSLTLLQSGGTIVTNTIYVRLTGAAVGAPSGNITNASSGITSLVAVSGTVQAAQPVELVSFKGQVAGNTVLLTWSTASERESERFVVQRSSDASEFIGVGTRQSAGNTNQQQYYSLTDESPQHGVNYYRLKQIDRDGSAVYSKAVAIRVDTSQPYASLRENPTDGQAIQLRLYQMTTPQVRLSALSGQTIAGQLARSSTTEAVYTPASTLTPGLYILTVQEGSVRQAIKVLVK
ncbi:T9SS type A sorting domain-containing protein [Fibrella aquatilis]|uniref:T9SS type A sorting domain-containing protein n=1 Tax=Fibrella aquatilis TaxID=2817059 RepID=A0A939G2B3_9BACT|nr:T9SS type A sorting domain-containing protein [Fibrella aquatilis]MBO0931032.1 T9SS type A sorting domain-containing protein [Fibrella aquatilis]